MNKTVCSLVLACAVQAAFAGAWPEGKDPATVSRRLSALLLSTDPGQYKPEGFGSPQGHAKDGYGGLYVAYSVVSLWVNALECARLTGDAALEKRLVDIFEPYYGERSGKLPKFGHVDFTIVGAVPLEIAALTGDERARRLGLQFADQQWAKPQANDPEPPYHRIPFDERLDLWRKGYSPQTRLWIDDMYMINVLQGLAYRVTGDRKYVDRAAKEMCLYLDKLQIKDGPDKGLFFHAQDVPYVWGRGAGWMAAGMPIILEYLPQDSEYRGKILTGYLSMMKALKSRQNANGTWNQLVGDTTSWEETSCTAMFGFGFAMGVKNGWLDAAVYGPLARKAYFAVLERSDRLGNVQDVCCGTDKKNDRQYYLDRPHVHGDPHGQCALMWMCRAFLEMEKRGAGSDRYLDIMEQAVRAYSDDHVARYLAEAEEIGVQEHGFPRLTANLGVLVANGRLLDRKAFLERMMTVACRDAAKGKMPPKTGGNEFSVRELVIALRDLERAKAFPEKTLAAWRSDLKRIEAERCYTCCPVVETPAHAHNWCIFGTSSERARMVNGLGGDPEFVERYVADQIRRFDANGMYRDPLEPAVYDFVTRLQFAATLHYGYDGASKAELEASMDRSAEPTLRMLSACGEIPYGGRSNQFLHNHTFYAALCEWYAARFAAKGDLPKARQFKAAARRALDALDDWLAVRPLRHVKNKYPKESGLGCEHYAYFNKYMVTMGSWALMAREFAVDLPAEEPPSAPWVFETTPEFHWVFMGAGDYSAQFDSAANTLYDCDGLGRIHRRGAPPQICLSTPCAEHPHYRIVGTNLASLAIAPVAKGKLELVKSESDAARAMTEWRVGEQVWRCTLSAEGMEMTLSGSGELALALPVFAFDGETHAKIEQGPKSVSTCYRGWRCAYETDGDIRPTALSAENRNGRYLRFEAHGNGTLKVRVAIRPIQIVGS